MKFPFLHFLFLAFALSFCSCESQEWETLFDGSSIDAWEQKGGAATYEIVDQELVGTAVLNTPNSFLCTKNTYGNFILELEVMLPNPLNSGVQFRSEVNADGRVNGYQLEIDPGERRFTGGIYDESRRGWLYPLSRNQSAQDAFKMGTWNKIRIECFDSDIRTYVNGQLCSYMIDEETAEGFIGLQVHSIGKKEEKGYQVKWRNIKIRTTDIEANRWPLDASVEQLVFVPNMLTEYEKENEWKLLSSENAMEEWRPVNTANSPIKNWTVQNGVISLDPEIEGGDIVTKEVFNDFELQLEFKISKGGNSGIKYFIDPTDQDSLSPIGCEYQILDDRNHPDAKEGKDGNRSVASLYDLIPADNITTPGRGKQFKGVNQWNHARILVKNSKVEHWLNNELALTYKLDSDEFRALVATSKYADQPNFGKSNRGRILLQDHGDEVQFRSIKIRPL